MSPVKPNSFQNLSQTRDELLLLASKATAAGNILEAIFNETMALGVYFLLTRFRNTANGPKKLEFEDVVEEILALDGTPESCRAEFQEDPMLLELFEDMLHDGKLKFTKDIEEKLAPWNLSDWVLGIKEITENMKRFPDEWTVIQVARDHDPKMFGKTYVENRCTSLPVNMTLFKYDRWDLTEHTPIRIHIEFDQEKNFYEKIYNYELLMKRHGEYKANYMEYVEECRECVKSCADDLKMNLGCFRHLLSGHRSDRSHLQKIYELVDEFCETNNLSPERKALLSLFATKVERIQEKEEFIQIGNYLGDTEELKAEITTFIEELSTSKHVKVLPRDISMPVMLIVDESIDHFFWELVNPEQEIIRNNSYNFLLYLFDLYKEQIVDGYMQVAVQKPFVLLNAHNNLALTEKRMDCFFKFWLPKAIIHKQSFPLYEQFNMYLNECDSYIYCGHGSGYDNIVPQILANEKLNKPAFLLGCQSIAYTYVALNQESLSPYHYFLLADCPAVIGFNYQVTDMSADKASSVLISLWTPTKSRKDWQDVNRAEWQTGIIIFQTAKTNKKLYAQTSPKVSKIIAELRVIERVADPRIKAALVHRGLPLYNTLIKTSN